MSLDKLTNAESVNNVCTKTKCEEVQNKNIIFVLEFPMTRKIFVEGLASMSYFQKSHHVTATVIFGLLWLTAVMRHWQGLIYM